MKAGVYNDETCAFEVREFTAAERADAQKIDPKHFNKPILEALRQVDLKTPRAVREAIKTGDSSRVTALENEAIALRAKLMKA